MFSFRVFVLGWIFDIVTTQVALLGRFVETNPLYAHLSGPVLWAMYILIPILVRVCTTLFGLLPGKWSYPLYLQVILFGILHVMAGIRNILVMIGL